MTDAPGMGDVMKALRLIAEGHPVRGEDDRFVVIDVRDLPEYDETRGDDPNMVINIEALRPPAAGGAVDVGRNITFSPSDDESGNAVISPEEPTEGGYWTLIAQGDEARQNAVAQVIVDRLNFTRPTGEEIAVTAPAAGGAVADPWKREDGVDEILSGYQKLITDTPLLLSLLYDADMLPEQIVSRRGAISVAAVCEAYKAAKEEGRPQATSLTGEEIAELLWDRLAAHETKTRRFADLAPPGRRMWLAHSNAILARLSALPADGGAK